MKWILKVRIEVLEHVSANMEQWLGTTWLQGSGIYAFFFDPASECYQVVSDG